MQKCLKLVSRDLGRLSGDRDVKHLLPQDCCADSGPDAKLQFQPKAVR